MHKSKGADLCRGADSQLLPVRPERPCEQRLLSGHRLRCPAAGGGQGRAVEIRSPSSTTGRSRWADRSRCFMRPRPMAGMWWAAAKSTPRLSATWNLQNKSWTNYNYVTKSAKKLLQNGNKRVTIWLQKGHERLLRLKSFSSCCLEISGAGPSPPPAVLLHSCRHCTAQAVSRFVCKKARPVFRTGFFAFPLCQKTCLSGGKV